MTQSNAEQYAIAKQEVITVLQSAENLSRTISSWAPPAPNVTIDSERAIAAAALNDLRRALIAIDGELTTTYLTELP